MYDPLSTHKIHALSYMPGPYDTSMPSSLHLDICPRRPRLEKLRDVTALSYVPGPYDVSMPSSLRLDIHPRRPT